MLLFPSHADVTCALAGRPLDAVSRNGEEGLLCLFVTAHPVCRLGTFFDRSVDRGRGQWIDCCSTPPWASFPSRNDGYGS